VKTKFLQYIAFAGLTILFVLAYITFVYVPIKNTVKEKIENDFIHEIELKSHYLDNELSRIKEGAKAISSRSMIRNKIVEYINGYLPFNKLQDYTTPKYLEGLKTLDNCFYARRMVGDKTVIEWGQQTSFCKDKFIADTAKHRVNVCTLIKEDNLKAGVVSPIYFKTQIVGYDIICSDNSEIIKNIRDTQINLEIYSLFEETYYVSGKKDTLSNLLADTLYQTPTTSNFLIKSKVADCYFHFSTGTDTLYQELRHFKKQQASFIIMATVLIMLVLLFIHQLSKQWYVRKGKYYENLASKKELELIKSHAEYKQLFELVHVGVVVTNQDGSIINSNQEAIRAINLRKEKHLGKSLGEVLDDIIRKDGTPMPIEELASTLALKEQKLITNIEMGIKDTADVIRWLKVSAVPKITGDGIIISFTDITEQITNENKLSQLTENLKLANATKDKFFSIISHDLRSPIGSLSKLLDLTYKNAVDGNFKDLDKYLMVMKETAQKSYSLLDNLLNWSRIQTGKIRLKPQVLVLKSTVNNMLGLLGSNIANKHLEMKINIPEGLKVYADKFMLETIIRNLLSNAIKYSSNGCTIDIQATTNTKQTQISITDSGVGISQKNQQKLFRVDKSFSTPGTHNESGTGLGLILCKEFVETHGGKIWLQSKEGRGSTFTFTLLR